MSENKNTRHLGLKITPKMWGALQRLADAEKRDISFIVREVLENNVKDAK